MIHHAEVFFLDPVAMLTAAKVCLFQSLRLTHPDDQQKQPSKRPKPEDLAEPWFASSLSCRRPRIQEYIRIEEKKQTPSAEIDDLD